MTTLQEAPKDIQVTPPRAGRPTSPSSTWRPAAPPVERPFSPRDHFVEGWSHGGWVAVLALFLATLVWSLLIADRVLDLNLTPTTGSIIAGLRIGSILLGVDVCLAAIWIGRIGWIPGLTLAGIGAFRLGIYIGLFICLYRLWPADFPYGMFEAFFSGYATAYWAAAAGAVGGTAIGIGGRRLLKRLRAPDEAPTAY